MAVLAPGTRFEQGNPISIGSITQITSRGINKLKVFLRDDEIIPRQRNFIIEFTSECRDSDFQGQESCIIVAYRYLPQACSAQLDDIANFENTPVGFPVIITSEAIKNYENLFIEGIDFTIPTALETLGVDIDELFCELEI